MITQRSLEQFHNSLIPANIEHHQFSALEEVWSCHPTRFGRADGRAIWTNLARISIRGGNGPVDKHLYSFPIYIDNLASARKRAEILSLS